MLLIVTRLTAILFILRLEEGIVNKLFNYLDILLHLMFTFNFNNQCVDCVYLIKLHK